MKPAPQSYLITFVLPDRTQSCLEVGRDEFILSAACQAGLDLPSMCLQGWCVTCAGKVEGKGDWDQSASRRYYPEDRAEGFILLCTARPRSSLRVHTHKHVAMRDHRLALKLPTPRG